MRQVLLGLGLIAFLSNTVDGQGAATAQAAATRKLYIAKCAKCHGSNGVPRPIAKGAKRFIDPAWSPPLEKVQEVIVTGVGDDMPKFKGVLTPPQILALAEFVLALKNRGT